MKNRILITLFLLFTCSTFIISQQVTGLSGWNIYLDPGHSGFENMGIYGYSEAEKNLRVGLNLRQMLLDWTDIDTVYICRETDQENVTLSQRTDEANSLAAAWYHSIHSDASSSPNPNSTLLLWGQYSNGLEKVPNGGKAMSDVMIVLLTAGMRTYTVAGSIGDCSFYGCTGSGPYLWVNRMTNMPSELSEAGFHTNPTQNQLNMNANWKRLEAKTFWWSILQHHGIQRPFAGTIAGIVKDIETGIAINGAVLSFNGQVDTTDTWASLFYKYTSDPNLLRNGFYYFEDIPPGTHTLQVTANGYEPYTFDVTMQDTFFTFVDPNMISTTPPVLLSSSPSPGDSLYPGYDELMLNFSRQMNKASVESNITITPTVAVTYTWSNSDKTVSINTSNFAFNTEYQITISGNAEGKYGHLFDGNGDGIGGDPLTFNIRTKVQDVAAPQIADVFPSQSSTDVDIRPIINFAFDEQVNTQTLSGKFKLVRDSDQSNAAGILRHYAINGRSVLNFFVTTPLQINEGYTIKLLPGVKDLFGNEILNEINYQFTTGSFGYNQVTLIENFENGINLWWQPEQSNSTVGVLAELTNAAVASNITNLNTGSTKSMLIEYGWDTNASNWLIREFYNSTNPTFGTSDILQVFLFGDGRNHKFRFAVNDQGPGGHEVSPWYTIDWIGWKLVNWDLSQGQTGNWVGNNILEPPLSFDSFQFTYEPGNGNVGNYFVDDLRTAFFGILSVEQENTSLPVTYNLEQNFPNPFNPSTKIKFSIPQSGNVKLIITDILGKEVSTLINDNLNAGSYSINFDASDISSGVYFYTLITENFKQSRKMILMK